MNDDIVKDSRKRWHRDGIEFVDPDPRWNDPTIAYEPKEMPKPTDVIYKLSYDIDLRYLKLNSFVIQTFQFESHADRYFAELFGQKSDIKIITVHNPAKADVLVNNISMPIKLRNAIFTAGTKGTRLQVHSVITRERAKKFGIKQQEINDYIDKNRDKHYKLLSINKRK